RALTDGNVQCEGSINVTHPSDGLSVWCSNVWTITAGAHVVRWELGLDGITDSQPNNNATEFHFTARANGCAGDCNFDAEVTVEEVVRAVSIALGTTQIDQCDAA